MADRTCQSNSHASLKVEASWDIGIALTFDTNQVQLRFRELDTIKCVIFLDSGFFVGLTPLFRPLSYPRPCSFRRMFDSSAGLLIEGSPDGF